MLSKKKGNPYFSFFIYFVPNTVGIWIKKKDYKDSTMCAWQNCEGQCKADQTVYNTCPYNAHQNLMDKMDEFNYVEQFLKS